MASTSRRSSLLSSAKRPAAAAESAGQQPPAGAPSQQQAKRRVALQNVTNQCGGAGRIPASVRAQSAAKKAGHKGASTTTTTAVKKVYLSRLHDSSLDQNSLVTSTSVKPVVIPNKDVSTPTYNGTTTTTILSGSISSSSSVISRDNVIAGSSSCDRSMSTCGSARSPNFEYIDSADSSAVASLERQASDKLHISEQPDKQGATWNGDVTMKMQEADDARDADNNIQDPQLCAVFASDIYKHLRMTETKTRPSMDFMEVIQKDVNASMRAILVDWLVEVSEEYRLVPDTLFLTVNYIDRYLSSNTVSRQQLQLLGVACMLIAAKYEEICAPQVEEFCYITDNTYFRDEVLEMEAAVMRHLNFQMKAPTAKCFLRRFLHAAQVSDQDPYLEFEFLASYLTELTLIEYSCLCYPPSLIAASAVFLAKFILQPTKRPWDATLVHYTSYKASELHDCVKALLHLFLNSHSSGLPAIREKFCQHKYKFVAKKYCPHSIPLHFFQNAIKSSLQ